MFEALILVLSIPHGDSEFFICPTLMTRRKTTFSKFFSCYVAVKISVHCSWTKSITLVLFATGRVSSSHSHIVLGKYSFTRNSSLVESNDHFKWLVKVDVNFWLIDIYIFFLCCFFFGHSTFQCMSSWVVFPVKIMISFKHHC